MKSMHACALVILELPIHINQPGSADAEKKDHQKDLLRNHETLTGGLTRIV